MILLIWHLRKHLRKHLILHLILARPGVPGLDANSKNLYIIAIMAMPSNFASKPGTPGRARLRWKTHLSLALSLARLGVPGLDGKRI